MDLESARITSFFRCPPEVANQIRLQALKKLHDKLESRAAAIGLKGTGYENCLEDWVNEGYIAAEEQIDRWNFELGGPHEWVFLKSKDIALRWFERFFTEYRKYQELANKGSSLIHDTDETAKDHHAIFYESEFIRLILKEDLSASDCSRKTLRDLCSSRLSALAAKGKALVDPELEWEELGPDLKTKLRRWSKETEFKFPQDLLSFVMSLKTAEQVESWIDEVLEDDYSF